jgi:hypothetical protein
LRKSYFIEFVELIAQAAGITSQTSEATPVEIEHFGIGLLFHDTE